MRVNGRAGLAARAYAPALAALSLAGFALRLVLLDRFPLREDEAIYGVWARSVAGDPWFLSVWPDKPPIFLWLQAIALGLFGPSAPALRWLSIAAGTLTVPLTAATARRLWGGCAALLAGLLMALNPFAIAFSPTGYTDTLLVACGMAAAALAVRGRAFWAGFWLGAAIMTKQQGLLYVPLISGLLAVQFRAEGFDRRSAGRSLARFILGAVAVALPILLWDAARWGVAPSPWDLGARNYGALTVAPVTEWPARAAAWGPLLWQLAGSGLAWALLVLAALAVGWATVRARTRAADRASRGGQVVGLEPRPRVQAGWVIAAWSAAFLLLHLVTTVQPWDRYLLPLAPMLALLGGWAIAALPPFPGARWALAATLVALAVLLPPAWAAAQGRTAAGADHGDLAGLDTVLGAVADAAAAQGHGAGRVVLYHRVTGWQARFYLYDAVQAGQVELRWFPSAAYLADNAGKTPHLRKFVLEPEWGATRDLALHLRTRGLAVVTTEKAGRYTLAELVGEAGTACAWCVSSPARTGTAWRLLNAPATEACR